MANGRLEDQKKGGKKGEKNLREINKSKIKKESRRTKEKSILQLFPRSKFS